MSTEVVISVQCAEIEEAPRPLLPRGGAQALHYVSPERNDRPQELMAELMDGSMKSRIMEGWKVALGSFTEK